MVEEAIHTIKTIVDNTWVTWVGWLVLNIAHHIKEEADVRDHEEKERKKHEEVEAKERLICKEAKRVVREEAKKVVWGVRHQQEKLDLFLNESITAEEFEKDLEVEAERSKVTGEGMVEDAFGTQMSEMEVDDAGEDEVVAEDKGTKGGRKQVPYLPPKLSRKWACASTTITSKSTVIEKAGNKSSPLNTCDRCCHYDIRCIPTNGGARCSNCKVKHYKCSLVPSKEGLEGKGVTTRICHLKTVTGSKVKVQEKEEVTRKQRLSMGLHLVHFCFFLFVWDLLKLASRSWS